MKPKTKHAMIVVLALLGIALMAWWMRNEAPFGRKKFGEAGRFLGERARSNR